MNERSEKNLKGVHPHLIRIVRECEVVRAGTRRPEFTITEGVRTISRQRQLVEAGASKTMNSRHIPSANGYAHAVDFAFIIGGKARWDWPLFSALAKDMKEAARILSFSIEWGGDWKSFKDGPHFQLPWKEYPGTKGT